MNILQVKCDLGGEISSAVSSDYFLTNIDKFDVAYSIVVFIVFDGLNE